MNARATRPVMIGVVAVLAGIQAVFAILGGLAFIIERNDADLVAHIDNSTDAVTAIGIYLIVVGVIELFVAVGLWSGSNLARIVAGIVVVLQLAGGLWTVIAYEGTYFWQGIWQILFAGLILYFLFNPRSARFFSS